MSVPELHADATNKIYWRGKPLETCSREELVAIIQYFMKQQASAGETINQLTDLIGYRQ